MIALGIIFDIYTMIGILFYAVLPSLPRKISLPQ